MRNKVLSTLEKICDFDGKKAIFYILFLLTLYLLSINVDCFNNPPFPLSLLLLLFYWTKTQWAPK